VRTLIVILLGLVTTALALAGVAFTAAHGTNLMGFHYVYVVPVGALLVGLVASSGFGAGAWIGGRRVDGWLFLVVAGTLLFGYFGAEYVEFRKLFSGELVDEQGIEIGFWSYFDLSTRAIHFGDKDALGAAGYLVRAVELVGFLAGGMGAPLALRARPYCQECRRYLRRKILAFVEPSEVAPILAQRASAPAFRAELESRAPASRWSEIQRLPERNLLRLAYCAACSAGSIHVETLAGLPDQREGQLAQVLPLDIQVVRALL
jgi:hypothetical protein